MYSGNGDPGIVRDQMWESKNGMDSRQAKVVGIDYDTGMIKLEWRPADITHPYYELPLTDFVQRFRRVEEVTPLTAA
ncbi:MAG TPA: hypothetical protein VFH06_01690 [Candidatus Saccharimonadales bacterium]|nr:hypothetical protein [Candidatus Saccharimonadales bacterium]